MTQRPPMCSKSDCWPPRSRELTLHAPPLFVLAYPFTNPGHPAAMLRCRACEAAARVRPSLDRASRTLQECSFPPVAAPRARLRLRKRGPTAVHLWRRAAFDTSRPMARAGGLRTPQWSENKNGAPAWMKLKITFLLGLSDIATASTKTSQKIPAVHQIHYAQAGCPLGDLGRNRLDL